MTFKPMTYLVSFTMFVALFMVLGGYVGYGKIADHFLTQGFLDARSISVHVEADQRGTWLHWEDKLQVQPGLLASIRADNRSIPLSISYSDASSPVPSSPEVAAIPLAAHEHVEDIRIDAPNRYLYVRVFAAARTKSEEITWLYRFDLRKRKQARHTAVNPILLPAPFKP